MFNQRALRIALSGALVTSIITSPLTMNFDRITSFAKEDNQLYSKPVDTLSFISSSETSQKIDYIKGNKKDETLDKLKDKVKQKALKVNSIKLSGKLDKSNKNLVESTDIAANVEDVRKNADLQAYLQDALQEGKRVYLYGSLTINEYKQLLNIDEIKIKTVSNEGVDGYVTFGEDLENLKKEKGPLKPNAVVNEESSSIIGFTLDQEEERQYVDINISSYENGKETKNKEEAYLQTIMVEQADLIEMEELNEKPAETALITTNKAVAANNQVSEAYGAFAIVTDGGKTVGRVDMDWTLYKESADTSSTYDYFTLAPTTQANHYNGAIATTIYQNIDIPTTSDELQKWTPQGDSNGSSYDLSLGYPYAITLGMNFADDMTIDDQSSLAYDYARWNVTDSNLDDEVFLGTAGWASTGTHAYATYQGKVTVYVGLSAQIPFTASKTVTVSYNY